MDISWEAAAGAVAYRVQLIDLDSGAPLSSAVLVQGTHAVLPGSFSRAAGVAIEAIPGERALGFFHLATSLWLMYLTFATTLNISLHYTLPGG